MGRKARHGLTPITPVSAMHTISQDSTISLDAFQAQVYDEIYMDELTDRIMARTMVDWLEDVGVSADELRVGPSSAWPIRPWPVYIRGHLIGEIRTTHSSPRFTLLPRNQRHADLLDLTIP